MNPSTLEPNNWVSKYADYLFNYAYHRINDTALAKDLVQDTFYAGLKSKDNFKGEASERTWLISILKRKVIDHYRKINSTKGKAEIKMNFLNDDENKNWIEEKVLDPFDKTAADQIENQELNIAIYECINKLPEKQAHIFIKRSIEGFDTEAICNEFEISSSNLWVIIHRARISLMDCLKKKWY